MFHATDLWSCKVSCQGSSIQFDIVIGWLAMRAFWKILYIELDQSASTDCPVVGCAQGSPSFEFVSLIADSKIGQCDGSTGGLKGPDKVLEGLTRPLKAL